jgi:hypothetical protein
MNASNASIALYRHIFFTVVASVSGGATNSSRIRRRDDPNFEAPLVLRILVE